MKLVSRTILSLAALYGCGAGMVCGHPHGDESAELAALRRENANLKQSLVDATKREQESSARLKEVKLRLEAMGAAILDGKDNRLVDAVADYEVLNRRLKEVEDAALALSSEAKVYLTTAIVADPDARARMETSLRELDIAIGLREKPDRDRLTGNLQAARVVSVDQASGAVVVNVGGKESATIGMPFEVFRNNNKVADALVASIRPDVSALLITNLENNENPVQTGDRVSFKRN